MKKRTQIRVDAYIQKLYYIFINISPNVWIYECATLRKHFCTSIVLDVYILIAVSSGLFSTQC